MISAISSHRVAPAPVATATGLTEVELTWIEGRYEQWILFGRNAAERIVNRRTRVLAFRPGSIFAHVRWTANDFGTIFSTIAIVRAVEASAPFSTLPFIRPGAEILLRIDSWLRVQRVLAAVAAIEADGIDPCDVAPDHWRHIGSRLAAGLSFRPYGAERHAAWSRRKVIEG